MKFYIKLLVISTVLLLSKNVFATNYEDFLGIENRENVLTFLDQLESVEILDGYLNTVEINTDLRASRPLGLMADYFKENVSVLSKSGTQKRIVYLDYKFKCLEENKGKKECARYMYRQSPYIEEYVEREIISIGDKDFAYEMKDEIKGLSGYRAYLKLLLEGEKSKDKIDKFINILLEYELNSYKKSGISSYAKRHFSDKEIRLLKKEIKKLKKNKKISNEKKDELVKFLLRIIEFRFDVEDVSDLDNEDLEYIKGNIRHRKRINNEILREKKLKEEKLRKKFKDKNNIQ